MQECSWWVPSSLPWPFQSWVQRSLQSVSLAFSEFLTAPYWFWKSTAFQSYASVLVNMAATSLLSFRVSAIWARNKGITFVLGLIILVQAICLFYVSSQTKPLETGFCVGGSDQTPVLYLYWSSPMICDLALIGLTLSRAWTLKRKNIKQRTVQLIIKAGVSGRRALKWDLFGVGDVEKQLWPPLFVLSHTLVNYSSSTVSEHSSAI